MLAVNVKKFLLGSILVCLATSASAYPGGRNNLSKVTNLTQTEQVEVIYKLLEKQGFTRISSRNTNWKVKKASMKQKTKKYSKSLRVTATAYTSHVGQTDSTPNIAAWGDRLKPGMKVIAVSRDLLNVYGLKHRQKVRIKGLEGEYLVLDKMNKRWRKKIDIYMGMNKRNAFKWGRRKVEIEW